jgi:hypothetical protein
MECRTVKKAYTVAIACGVISSRESDRDMHMMKPRENLIVWASSIGSPNLVGSIFYVMNFVHYV